ncbi:hypothetical protein NPIL_121651 [Nephila pilipes]|uniref:Uncharacterized protein n=1 Tax=Nephila pilipes TaxID=299642 RepID=A0A8X6I582_NEPPI|nr:hypothetical protein NPIL_121651 [Nephila pilipes]
MVAIHGWLPHRFVISPYPDEKTVGRVIGGKKEKDEEFHHCIVKAADIDFGSIVSAVAMVTEGMKREGGRERESQNFAGAALFSFRIQQILKLSGSFADNECFTGLNNSRYFLLFPYMYVQMATERFLRQNGEIGEDEEFSPVLAPFRFESFPSRLL